MEIQAPLEPAAMTEQANAAPEFILGLRKRPYSAKNGMANDSAITVVFMICRRRPSSTPAVAGQ
ncbi:hypothetical protein [Microvirgula aerodenitrificans]|uniref:hypothetical protein n=1 Tax=Microvirgula aerodenitrificans TaxID=57480 RepID=UPI0012EB8FEE|nr:hypothetical protein [Microvirgula aerodenitrificans]